MATVNVGYDATDDVEASKENAENGSADRARSQQTKSNLEEDYRSTKRSAICSVVVFIALIITLGAVLFIIFFYIDDPQQNVDGVPDKGRQTEIKGAFIASATITIVNLEFTPSLSDEESEEFNDLENRLHHQLYTALSGTKLQDRYEGIEIRDVRSGSVIVDFLVLLCEPLMTEEVAITTMLEALTSSTENDEITEELVVQSSSVSVEAAPSNTTMQRHYCTPRTPQTTSTGKTSKTPLAASTTPQSTVNEGPSSSTMEGTLLTIPGETQSSRSPSSLALVTRKTVPSTSTMTSSQGAVISKSTTPVTSLQGTPSALAGMLSTPLPSSTREVTPSTTAPTTSPHGTSSTPLVMESTALTSSPEMKTSSTTAPMASLKGTSSLPAGISSTPLTTSDGDMTSSTTAPMTSPQGTSSTPLVIESPTLTSSPEMVMSSTRLTPSSEAGTTSTTTPDMITDLRKTSPTPVTMDSTSVTTSITGGMTPSTAVEPPSAATSDEATPPETTRVTSDPVPVFTTTTQTPTITMSTLLETTSIASQSTSTLSPTTTLPVLGSSNGLTSLLTPQETTALMLGSSSTSPVSSTTSLKETTPSPSTMATMHGCTPSVIALTISKYFNSSDVISGRPVNYECSWEFIAVSNDQIRLEFLTFDLGDDTLELTLGSGRTVSFSGSTSPGVQLTDGNTATVTLRTNSQRNDIDFRILIEVIVTDATLMPTLSSPIVGCVASHTVLTEENKTLSSPGYLTGYTSNMDCEWTLQSTVPNTVIAITFVNFDLGDDLLRIQFHETTLQYTGSALPMPILTGVDVVQLHFTSNDAGNNPGFELVASLYTQALPVTATTLPAIQTATETITTELNDNSVSTTPDLGCISGSSILVPGIDPRRVTSPGYPTHNYASNTDCSWDFMVIRNTTKRIHVQFTNFDVGDDKVVVKYGPLQTSTFRGTDSPGNITTLDNNLRITLETDSEDNHSGFEAYVSVVDG